MGNIFHVFVRTKAVVWKGGIQIHTLIQSVLFDISPGLNVRHTNGEGID